MSAAHEMSGVGRRAKTDPGRRRLQRAVQSRLPFSIRRPQSGPRGGGVEALVWSHAGIICAGGTYKNVVKMTFAKGASLDDPSGLFNSSLDENTRRAIDFHEGERIDEEALKALIRAAAARRADCMPAASSR